jgi:cold-inducible RNA-binding protein
MGRKLFVSNLPFQATQEELRATFEECGAVESAKIITDQESGRSKGFGFVEMSTEDEAANAISQMNGSDYEGRALKVDEAKPKIPRTPGSWGSSLF